MTPHTLAGSFRLCDNAKGDFLLKAYIVLWIIVFIAVTIMEVRDFIQADSREARKQIVIDFFKCIPVTFILPFPLAGAIIAVLIFLLVGF